MTQMSLAEQLYDGQIVDGHVRCLHANIFGCPNHGAMARAAARPLPRLVRHGYEQGSMLMAPPSCWPIGYVLTDRGRAANRGEWFPAGERV
jgi:hypothetical protein